MIKLFPRSPKRGKPFTNEIFGNNEKYSPLHYTSTSDTVQMYTSVSIWFGIKQVDLVILFQINCTENGNRETAKRVTCRNVEDNSNISATQGLTVSGAGVTVVEGAGREPQALERFDPLHPQGACQKNRGGPGNQEAETSAEDKIQQALPE